MRLRAAALAAVLGLTLGACTGGTDVPGDPTSAPQTSVEPVPASPEVPSPAPGGPDSAAAATKRLCEISAPRLGAGSDVPAEGPTPAVIAQVMRQVAQIRGFDYSQRVVAEPVSQAEIGRDILRFSDITYPEGQYARRSIAWDTIGVIPDGTSLRDAYESYGSSQVVGYYDTVRGELKFIGSESPSPLERITLAHELTHAIDDQRFGLERLDALGAACKDEDASAAIALVEGNATFFMLRWARTFLTLAELVQVEIEAAGQDVSTEGVPPFVARLQVWPYEEGMRFIAALEARGGLDEVDEAFVDLPTSTEQIIHPERYPNDAPTPVDVPDLSAALGEEWEDLDVMAIGEAWLQIALGLRLDGSDAGSATAGWDGGTYRAWSDGSETAVVLSTAWDSPNDAREFAAAMTDWIDQGDEHATVLESDGTVVTSLFATDAATLETLQAAAA